MHAARLPEAISVKHAAFLLEVSEISIRRWIRLRYIEAVRVGPFLIRIPRSEIARMRKHRVTYLVEEDVPKYRPAD